MGFGTEFLTGRPLCRVCGVRYAAAGHDRCTWCVEAAQEDRHAG